MSISALDKGGANILTPANNRAFTMLTLRKLVSDLECQCSHPLYLEDMINSDRNEKFPKITLVYL